MVGRERGHGHARMREQAVAPAMLTSLTWSMTSTWR
jgi:hypothetical protein